MKYINNSLFAVLCFVLVLFGTGGSAYAQTTVGGKSLVYVVPVKGVIDLGLAPFIQRVLAGANQHQATAVILDINTLGGRVDAAVQIRDALLDSPVRTIAFVDKRAISAGALIALASENIVMAPGGTIGAATPVQSGRTGETAETIRRQG